jgi:cytochrome c-type biogenesis protein
MIYKEDTNMTNAPLLGIFIAGILTFLSPCILPLMPLYLSYVSGNFDSESQSTKDSLLISLGFVLGLMLVFSLFGLTATALGRFVNLNGKLFRQISGAIIIFFGLYHMGLIKLSFLAKEKKFKIKTTGNLFLNAFILGLVFSFGWTPCIGPILASILILLASTLTIGTGILYMVVFSIGFSIPFIITTFLLGKLFKTINISEKAYAILKYFTGSIIVAIGLLVIFNYVSKIIVFLS